MTGPLIRGLTPNIETVGILVSEGYRIGELGYQALTADGLQFVTITSHGRKDEGAFILGPEFNTSDEAIAALYEHIEAYKRATPGGMIWWRRMPEASRDTDRGLWMARCRMVIGDDPAAFLGQDQRKHLAGMIGNAIVTLMWAGVLFSRSPDWWSLIPTAGMLWGGWAFECRREAFIGPKQTEVPE